jgi:O-antigen/teichoic acid export membrane protein
VSDPAPAQSAGTETAATETKDVAHAARSGAMQALTVAAQAMLMVTQILLVKLFGAVVFGSYQTCLAIVEMLTRAGTGGADKGMLRYVAAHRARGEADLVRGALGTGLRLALGTAGTLALALIAAAGIVAWRVHAPALQGALRIMAPAAICTGCVYVLVNASLAAKVTHANFIVRGLGEPMLLMAAGLMAALFGRTLTHLATAHVLAAALTLTLALFVVGRVFGRGEIARAIRTPWLPGFAGFSVPIGAAELLNTILQRADVILLTTFVGPKVTAIYAAAEFISRIIGNARYIFDAVAAPVFAEAMHLGQADRLRDNLRLMSRWVVTAAAPIAVTVMALRHDLLSLYGPTFQAGSVAIVVLSASHLVNASLGLTGYVVLVAGRSRLIVLYNLIAAGLNVTLNLILIPRFGMVGGAIGALVSVTCYHTLFIVTVRLEHGASPIGWATLKPLAAAAAMLAVESWIGGHVAHVGRRIPLVIASGLLSYLGVLVALGLAPEDRRLFAGLWNRIRPGAR